MVKVETYNNDYYATPTDVYAGTTATDSVSMSYTDTGCYTYTAIIENCIRLSQEQLDRIERFLKKQEIMMGWVQPQLKKQTIKLRPMGLRGVSFNGRGWAT